MCIINLNRGVLMTRVLISMPEKFLNEIDNLAEEEQRTRSELIREALRTYVYKKELKRSNVKKAQENALILDAILS